jgi:sec-independent protein translocase protein TatA
MGEFSLTHILLLAVVVLIFFGPSRLPALGQSLGKAIRGFKSGLSEIDAEAKAVPPEKNEQFASQRQAQLNTSSERTAQAEKATEKTPDLTI